MKNSTLKATLITTFTILMGTILLGTAASAENSGCDSSDMYSHKTPDYSHGEYKDEKSYEYKNSKNYDHKDGYEKSGGYDQHAHKNGKSSSSYSSDYNSGKSYSGSY